jgi:site-specific DNA-methyltransferase (adenine-specific)
VLARKPLAGTVAANALEHGCGALAIDASRIAYASEADRAAMSAGVEAIRARGGVLENSWKNSSDLSGANPAHAAGRWPANVLLDEAAAAMLDEQSGESVSTPVRAHVSTGAILPFSFRTAGGFSDSGGASRFFYVAKASRSEREAGCEGNAHPTVKPIALTTYVARLLLPPPGARPRRLLVPFSGSGSEVIGALLAGWDEVIGIEIDDEYRRIAEARIAHWMARGAPKPKAPRKAPPAPKRRTAWVQATLFDL